MIKIESARKYLSPEKHARQFIEEDLLWHAYKIYYDSRAGLDKVDIPTFVNILMDVVGVEFAIKARQKYEQMELFA